MKPLMRVGLTIAIVMVALLGLAAADRASATPTDAPSSTVSSFARYTLMTSNGITGTTNGTAVRIAGFEYIDCFAAIDVTLWQTVTMSYQASADGTNYATAQANSAVSADATVMTRTLVYGEYFRPVATLGTTNPVTISVKCVAKN
jgi:hypothetical protein